jgi:sarcosine dehydrogenase
LKKKGAVFGSKLGWERANWFAPEGMAAQDVYSMGRQNWFAQVGEEHKAVRETAGLFDQTSFAKFEMKGPDAEAVLKHICANKIPAEPGKLVYTQLLNQRGGIECDLTVARLTEDHFYIVTGTGFRTHDFHWIADHIPKNAKAKFIDVTESYGTLSLMGPLSREILQMTTYGDISAKDFKFGDVKTIGLKGHPVRVLRVTYVGELGYELHVPIHALTDVYSALLRAGEKIGLKLAGYRAIESLRLEKGYRAWGADITPNDTPLEAGLGWAVKLKTNEDFIGRTALETKKSKPLKKMLVGFTTEREDVVLLGRETILRDGKFAGYLTSGGYGYTLKKPIGYGYVRNADGVSDSYVMSGNYELVVAQQRVKATPHLKPLYDPTNARIKA